MNKAKVQVVHIGKDTFFGLPAKKEDGKDRDVRGFTLSVALAVKNKVAKVEQSVPGLDNYVWLRLLGESWHWAPDAVVCTFNKDGDIIDLPAAEIFEVYDPPVVTPGTTAETPSSSVGKKLDDISDTILRQAKTIDALKDEMLLMNVRMNAIHKLLEQALTAYAGQHA